MQSLGLSESTPRPEGRWRALLWPNIRNVGDFDYITRQGFWICFLIATVTLVSNVLTGHWLAGILEACFYFLAAIGVRERSRVAAIGAFLAYLLSALVAQRYTGSGFGFVTIGFLALLFANIRGNVLSARWANDPCNDVRSLVRLNETCD